MHSYVFPTAWLKANRDVVRRLLMGYLEGITIFRHAAQRSLRGPRRGGLKDPAVQKDIYERAFKHMRQYPVPEPNGKTSSTR